jgi:hypothetical protein
MLRKLVPGVKEPVNMDSMVIFAWCATGRAVCWWHSHPENARIVLEQELKCRVNIKTAAKSAVVLDGHTSLKMQPR